MRCTWTAELWLPHPPEVLFRYLTDVRNLDRVTPPWLRVRILTEGPIQMASGTRIDYRLRLHGLPFRWQTEIALWEPPTRFVERQGRGPYRSWDLQHEFVLLDGGTLIRDEMRYEVAGGLLVDRLIVRPNIKGIFAFRAQHLREIFRPTDVLASHRG